MSLDLNRFGGHLGIFTNGKMDLDSSPTDSEGLELVLQICFGGHEDVLGTQAIKT